MSSDLGVKVLVIVIIHTHTDCALVELGRHAAQRTVKTFILINIKKSGISEFLQLCYCFPVKVAVVMTVVVMTMVGWWW